MQHTLTLHDLTYRQQMYCFKINITYKVLKQMPQLNFHLPCIFSHDVCIQLKQPSSSKLF